MSNSDSADLNCWKTYPNQSIPGKIKSTNAFFLEKMKMLNLSLIPKR